MKNQEALKFEAYIVEDSEEDYIRIASYLESVGIKVLGKYLGNHPYENSVSQIKILKPNLLIIDHELNAKEGLTGLDLFHEISSPYIFGIFCSQYIKAMENDSVFLNAKFVLKDIDSILFERLESRIQAAREYFRRLPDSRILSVSTEEMDIVIHINEICYFEAAKDHTKVYLYRKERPILIKKGIGEIYINYQLEGLGFVRVSKSHVVNMFQINSIRPNRNVFSRKMVIMDHIENKKCEIPIGKKYLFGLRSQYFLDRYKK